jgi:hypothetical protein
MKKTFWAMLTAGVVFSGLGVSGCGGLGGPLGIAVAGLIGWTLLGGTAGQ